MIGGLVIRLEDKIEGMNDIDNGENKLIILIEEIEH